MALTDEEIDRIIEMAWEDRTPFDAIEKQFGYNESATIALMRKEMKKVVSLCGASVLQGAAPNI